MKIILASKEKFLLNKGYDLCGINRENLKIGIINTAFQVVEDREYIQYIEEYFDLMKSARIDFKELDIKDKTEKEILDFFSDRNIIQVLGGNVFYLLKIIRELQFDLILKKLLEKGLNYIGCSSGSYIMCPTVEVASWRIGRDRYGLTDFSALNYFPYLIKCHFTDDKKEEMIQKAKTLKCPLKVLKDDQCFLLEENKISFFGNNKEVIL
jgi:dipeptidase E